MKVPAVPQQVARLLEAKSRKAVTNHPELAGYVQAFKDSSDRSRRMIFVITTVCVLLLIAQWNIQEWSWSSARIHRALEREGKLRRLEFPPLPRNHEEYMIDLRRQMVFETYPQQFVERMLLIQLPAVGITLDVNEFGLFGGITLLLLMLLLWSALARQHENLQLAVFKIRRIFEREQRPDDGESTANYLYHALAMTQMLSMPPTLARWNHRSFGRVTKFGFFAPVVLQVWVALSNDATRKVALYYFGEVQVARLLAQKALAGLVCFIAIMCYGNARAMEKRWKGIFFRINPRHDAMKPDSVRTWLKLHSRWTGAEKALRKKLRQVLLVGAGTGGEKGVADYCIPSVDEPLVFGKVARWNVASIAHRLQKHARNAARRSGHATGTAFPELTWFRITSVKASPATVTIEWAFRNNIS